MPGAKIVFRQERVVRTRCAQCTAHAVHPGSDAKRRAGVKPRKTAICSSLLCAPGDERMGAPSVSDRRADDSETNRRKKQTAQQPCAVADALWRWNYDDDLAVSATSSTHVDLVDARTGLTKRNSSLLPQRCDRATPAVAPRPPQRPRRECFPESARNGKEGEFSMPPFLLRCPLFNSMRSWSDEWVTSQVRGRSRSRLRWHPSGRIGQPRV